ncbi:MAG: bifunctional phosphoribosylaminoimidazolecarboxamide formyltransferase/IMP cyclohydrolase [Candidatus Caldatribacteriota bacterium]|nr:bifunctional phosphoribosylaminoimidazolecarboxamide formyltransferase/IMP cyclohydrolase [Candidatus Caldatribacteriota bacterium]
MNKIKRALISVSDKEGIVDFARGLQELGIEIISTGGTAKLLRQENVEVTLISEVTGFPEILEGRVKTLHPLIFGGILAKRESALHQQQIKEQKIGQIDLVVVNLYPFEKTTARKDVTLEEAIENIDIGGPSLLRAAAKNYQDISVVIQPENYPAIIRELKENNREISLKTKKRLAVKVFEHTAYYDAMISKYLSNNMLKEKKSFPSNLNLSAKKKMDLRYGENPHQHASFYREPFIDEANLGNAIQLGGKELSFNNLVDLNGVLEIIKDFNEPAVVFVKHTNPCGLASAENIQTAYKKAYEGDPLSAYGSIIGINRAVDAELAHLINNTTFVEAILAPDFQEDALEILRKKKNRRILKVGDLSKKDMQVKDIKKISGGFLVQDRNLHELKIEDLKIVSEKKPAREELKELLFAWKTVKHIKSNAIVLTKDKQIVGVGAGQMSRVDSVKIAGMKSKDRSDGSCLASDAFFPFRDGVDEAAKAGVIAIIQPGGSKRDREIIDAANENGLAMVFTGTRCFKH